MFAAYEQKKVKGHTVRMRHHSDVAVRCFYYKGYGYVFSAVHAHPVSGYDPCPGQCCAGGYAGAPFRYALYDGFYCR